MIDQIRKQMASWFQKEKTTVKKKQTPASYTQRDMFFANMSHEIRTPVNGIVGFTQLLKETKLDKEQDELVNTIHASSMHLLGLVNDILDFSKINAHKMTLEETEFDLFRQVEDTIETYAAVAQEKGIALELYIDPVISPTLIGDPSKLSQILINLVSNALKFTDALGRVDVAVEKVMEGQKMVTLRFSVQDTGIGISPGAQKNIFNAFAQANSSISRKFGGTGLGLAISSELVKLMGGELVVDSAPDEGSEFSFTLAFEKVRSQERKIYADRYRGLSAGIVLAQKGQNRSTEKNLKAYLSYLGMDVHLYSSVEIVSMNTKVLPDLLFADEHLAGIPLKELSEMDVKFIPISSLNGKNRAADGNEKRCEGIYKPVNLTKTIRALEACLEDASADKEETLAINRNFKGFRALVVDDNRVNQKLMMRVLENMQMDVELAFDGEEALEYCQSIDFDIIFMDIQMPVMDGVEATRKIVAWEQAQGRAHTPIIALTGNADNEDMQAYMDVGMDGFMTKPVDINIMLSYLNKYTVAKTLVYQMDRQEVTFSGAKALIVEENSINQKLIERALVSRGVESTLISRASILMNAYRKEKFNILFISAGMPMVNASEAIREIRLYEMKNSLPAVPVVIIVPKDTSETECSDYREVGVNGCLFKPLDIDEIKQELDRCIRYDQESVKQEEVSSPSTIASASLAAAALGTDSEEREYTIPMAVAEEEREEHSAEEEGLIPLLEEDTEQESVIPLKDAYTEEALHTEGIEKSEEREPEAEHHTALPEQYAEEHMGEEKTMPKEETGVLSEGIAQTEDTGRDLFDTHMVKEKTVRAYEEAMLELKDGTEENEIPDEVLPDAVEDILTRIESESDGYALMEEEEMFDIVDTPTEEVLAEEEASPVKTEDESAEEEEESVPVAEDVPAEEETAAREVRTPEAATAAMPQTEEAAYESSMDLLSEEEAARLADDLDSGTHSDPEEETQPVEAVETENFDSDEACLSDTDEKKIVEEEAIEEERAAQDEEAPETAEESEVSESGREEPLVAKEEKVDKEELLATEEASELPEHEDAEVDEESSHSPDDERIDASPEIEAAAIPEPEEAFSETAVSTESVEEPVEAAEAEERGEMTPETDRAHEAQPIDEEDTMETEEEISSDVEVPAEEEDSTPQDVEPTEAEIPDTADLQAEEAPDEEENDSSVDTAVSLPEAEREATAEEESAVAESTAQEEVEVVKIGETRHVVQYIDIPLGK